MERRNFILGSSILVALSGALTAQSQAVVGQVFTLSNATSGNAVLAFDRAPSGRLTPAGSYATGGLGTGGGLGSQHALILSSDGSRLFAVDAGSNEVSVFDLVNGALVQRDREPSGGTMPTSVTVFGNLLYVLNAGGNGNVAGFVVDSSGDLAPLQGSTRALSGSATSPAQVQFGPGGTQVFVTERVTNKIDTFSVDADGRLANLVAHDSNGATPFGFAFGRKGTLIVAEAFGGAPDASAVSSYKVDPGSLTLASGSVATTETAACWLEVTKGGRFAYTTNAGSGSISGYFVGTDGSLTLLDADGVTASTGAGSGPIDEALSRDGRYLYVLARSAGRVAAFRIRPDGSLQPVDAQEGLPTSAAGLAAR
jgi:6-phosphogluconolactonase (cycloisomerase 2 family)